MLLTCLLETQTVERDVELPVDLQGVWRIERVTCAIDQGEEQPVPLAALFNDFYVITERAISSVSSKRLSDRNREYFFETGQRWGYHEFELLAHETKEDTEYCLVRDDLSSRQMIIRRKTDARISLYTKTSNKNGQTVHSTYHLSLAPEKDRQVVVELLKEVKSLMKTWRTRR